MENMNYFNMDDLASVLAELEEIEADEEPLSEEEIASQKRYEEIIVKHREE